MNNRLSIVVSIGIALSVGGCARQAAPTANVLSRDDLSARYRQGVKCLAGLELSADLNDPRNMHRETVNGECLMMQGAVLALGRLVDVGAEQMARDVNAARMDSDVRAAVADGQAHPGPSAERHVPRLVAMCSELLADGVRWNTL